MATLLKPFINESRITTALQREPINVEIALGIPMNNIVKVGSRSKNEVTKIQSDFKDFSNFMDLKVKELKGTNLPDRVKLRRISNLNLIDTFGTTGGLLSSLVSGALDVAGLLGEMFPGKGKPIGGKPGDVKTSPKPIPRGTKLRIPGIRGIPVLNSIFAGLDFATGLAEGETIGKAASGAGGSLAGSLLGGAIGQALIPVPGLGFVIGSTAGGFLGGYLGDRAYEGITGGKPKEKTQEEIAKERTKKELETARRRKRDKESDLEADSSKFKTSIEKFEKSTTTFKEFVVDLLAGRINVFLGGESREGEEGGEGSAPQPEPGAGGEVPTTPEGLPALPPITIPERQAYRAPRPGGRRHAGQDFDISGDEKFYSRLGGEVIFAGNVGGAYGNIVEIYNKDLDKTESIAEANHIFPNIKVGMVIAPGTPVVWGERTVPVDGSVGVIHYEISSGRGGIGLGIHDKHENPLTFLNSQTYRDYIKTKVNRPTSSKPTSSTPSISPLPSTPSTATPISGPRSSLPTTPLSSTIASVRRPNFSEVVAIPGTTQVMGTPSRGSSPPPQMVARQPPSSPALYANPVNLGERFTTYLLERKLNLA